jgi:hypothetical protein
MSLDKFGNLVTDNTVELIIAAAGIVVLVFLLIALYSPTYDEEAKTAESYFEMFNEQLSSVNSGVEGSLTFWGGNMEDLKFYLVYFGRLSSFPKSIGGEDLTFVVRKKNENAICVCYGNEDKMNCKFCKELDFPVEFSQPVPWALNPVKRLKMTKSGDKYLFSVGG